MLSRVGQFTLQDAEHCRQSRRVSRLFFSALPPTWYSDYLVNQTNGMGEVKTQENRMQNAVKDPRCFGGSRSPT
jgi:hypothetical protein